MPMKVSPSPMGRQPILLSRILRAASASVVLGVVHSTRRLINSRTIMAGLLLRGGPDWTEPAEVTGSASCALSNIRHVCDKVIASTGFDLPRQPPEANRSAASP